MIRGVVSSIIASLPPIVPRRPRLLLLGSMPGAASLARGEYYAHPQNGFWRAMSALTGAGANLPYARRVAALRARGVALWDALAECERDGSLDSAIRNGRRNDVAGLLARFPRIRAVGLNGGTALRVFRRDILPELPPQRRAGLQVIPLPSTSPAHARMSMAQKRDIWAAALSPHLR